MISLFRRDGITDSVPSCGKNNKEQAADEANSNRNNVQNLLCLMSSCRVQAAHHVLVPQGHRSEHQHRQQRVDPIYEPPFVLAQIGQARTRDGRVEDVQSFGRRESIEDPAIGRPDAVGETRDKAGDGEQDEEDDGERARGGVARAVVGEDRHQELEGQEGTRREEVGQVGGADEGLGYGSLREGRRPLEALGHLRLMVAAAAAAVGSFAGDRRRWPLGGRSPCSQLRHLRSKYTMDSGSDKRLRGWATMAEERYKEEVWLMKMV